MRRGVIVSVLVCLMMSLCSCYHAEIGEPLIEQTAETEAGEKGTITQEYIERLQGYWAVVDGMGAFEMMVFENATVNTGLYPGEWDREAEITEIVKNADGSLDVKLYFPETYQYEELLPEARSVMHMTSSDDFRNYISLGEGYNYIYMADTFEEMVSKLDEIRLN